MSNFSPTPEQEKITLAAMNEKTSLMVSAYAGTGKTTTLTMLAKALPPEPAIALAFNVKIKKELEARFPDNFSVLTLNGAGHRAWGKTIGKVSLDERKLSKITNEMLKSNSLPNEFYSDTIKLVTAAMNAGIIPSYFPPTIYARGLREDSHANWEDLALDNDLSRDVITIAREILIESILVGHGAEKRKPTISFDDQIYLPTFFGGNFNTTSLLMVDEAQDLSPVQHRMLSKICPKGRLIVVGDPRQAIYGFRGADSSSMQSLRVLRPKWIDLSLTKTFRCPKVIVSRQQKHAPGYTAAETNKEGTILDLTGQEEWTWEQIPPSSSIAVLCRNNGPIVSLALKLLSKGISISILGRDIGKNLITLAKKITSRSDSREDCITKIIAWREQETELAKINEKEHKISGIEDRAMCLLAVAEVSKSGEELISKLSALFAEVDGKITLSSGHRSKGLEWKVVIHLDPWRIPSKYAIKAAAEGDKSQLEQEKNLHYVIETRTQETLVLANLKEFKP